MSTAILSAPIRRFAWKEYRTLRGLWAAVLILGLLVDWLTSALLAPPVDFAAVRLTIALAAAALYAAGAAAILFSMEHEENTYDFLRGLPATWQPIFLGKFALAASSAILLAAVLAIFGAWTLGAGAGLPSSENASLAFGIFGVAIVEALAWGTLWSLLIKRPLAAAVVTLFVGSLVANCAVSFMGNGYVAPSDLRTYINAIPLRLAIVVAVLGTSVLVARTWLGGSAESSVRSTRRRLASLSILRTKSDAMKGQVANYVGRTRRRSMLLRLVWQSWRESWKLLALPAGLAGICLLITWICEYVVAHQDSLAPAIGIGTIFFGPTLYGALAFAADQRRGNVRFLAEHAAMPRYVWLSRHVVWLGALFALTAVLSVAVTMVVTTGLQYRWQDPRINWGRNTTTDNVLREMAQFLEAVGAVSGLTWFGSLAAYSIGQLCSMLVRSEILAAFVALVLAVVLSAWVAVLFVWGLSAYLFLLLLAVGLMLATWLRAPGWIEGRNTWRAWLRPALAVVGTFAVLGVLLPRVRLAQVAGLPRNDLGSRGPLQVEKPEAEATAEMHLRAVSMFYSPIDEDPLVKWRGPEFLGPNSVGPGDIDETMIPSDQMEAYIAAEKEVDDAYRKVHSEALKVAMQASERPACFFHFQLGPISVSNGDYSIVNSSSLHPGKTYSIVDSMLLELIHTSADGAEGAVPFDQLMATLRMSAHIRAGQSTAIFVRQLEREQQILKAIGNWAGNPNLTNDERRAALAKLEEYFQTQPDIAAAFAADREAIRQVIDGKDLPFMLSEKPIKTSTNFAMLANQLPWERVRALEALDAVTTFNVWQAEGLTKYLTRPTPTNNGVEFLKKWVRPDSEQPAWIGGLPATLTSYLMSMEYKARVPVNETLRQYTDTIACRHAALTQIALAMYRADHKEYPPTLAKLVPDYLKVEPLDPYSMQSFLFQPEGLDDPLQDTSQPEFKMSVAAHTPFFWSVGPNNWQLQWFDNSPPAAWGGEGKAAWPGGPSAAASPEGSAAPPDVPAAPSDGGTPTVGSHFYMYSGSQGAWYMSDPTRLIFVLPK